MCVITVCCFSPPGPGPKKLEIPAGVQRPSVPVATSSHHRDVRAPLLSNVIVGGILDPLANYSSAFRRQVLQQC